MRDVLWTRLGLSEDEWHECRLAALEMTVSSGARVSPRQVAVEYALARAFEEPAPARLHQERRHAARRVPATMAGP